MNNLAFLLTLSAFIAAGACGQAKQLSEGRCLSVDERLSLQGIVVSEARYGPPNFGENPKTDQKMLVRFLKLNAPRMICAGIDLPTGPSTGRESIQKIQLLTTRSIKGGRHIVDGTLSPAVSASHFTDLVMTVESVQ